MNYKLYPILLFLFFVPAIVMSQFSHPELEWQTLETKHFVIHFHQGTERTAQETAQIAESVYGPITIMYGYEPDSRVNFVICDYDDYSNGGTDFINNRIVIWASAMDFELRGTHPWLWNVVTHEFTHMVQIQTTLKIGRKVPWFYFQWIGYEAERRPDVLYGYPNVVVSYPISGFVLPNWFAEGTAQYNNPSFQYDTWDTHRDMILRMYMIDGNPISWEEMGYFEKTSLGSESVYNSGFSLVGYIAEHYGIDKLREISQQLAVPFRLTMDGAIEAALGKTGRQLYEEWKESKVLHYKSLADSLRPILTKEEMIESEGFWNFYPVFSPDGSSIAYISNKGMDYSSLTSVYVYDRTKKKSSMIVPQANSTLSFSPNAQNLYYAHITRKNPHWSALSDLFKYNIAVEHEERLTYGLRAFNPKLSSDGKKIVYTFGSNGTLNLALCDTNGKNIFQLTHFTSGEQVYTPVWSNDGKKIAFGYSVGHNESVAMIDSNGENMQLLTHAGDCRDPYFGADSLLYYSWDRGGIFNIYALNIRTLEERQITNVLGGAFLPTLNTAGKLSYVTYTSSGYKIAVFHSDSSGIKLTYRNSVSLLELNSRGKNKIGEQSSSMLFNTSSSGNGTSIQPKPYRSMFTSIIFTPLLRVDLYNESSKGIDVIKPGLLLSSMEMLDKMSFFGGATINRKLERDLFLNIDYSGRLPILYQAGLEPKATIELYNITRSRDVSFDLPGNPPPIIQTEVTYNLFEFDFSLSQKIFSSNCDLKVGYSLSKYSQDFGVWIDPLLTPPRVIQASRSTYFIGNSFSLQLKYNGIIPTVDREINPTGRTLSFKYFYDSDNFNPTDASENDNGFRKPIYTPYFLNRVELGWSEHFSFPLPKHTVSLTLNAAGILGTTVDDFFDYYAGGFIGMRGYPFYAIGGNRTVTINATYRFPLLTEINFRLLQFYFTKLYGSVFADLGDGWSGSALLLTQMKRDVGFELRLESISFYEFPTRIFFSGAYGLDQFTRTVQDINIRTVSYGHEWRFYLGVLFGFELNDIIPRQFMR